MVITHNGDFEEYTLFGERVSNSLAGRWLGLVLHAHNSCAGDSPKIAGFRCGNQGYPKFTHKHKQCNF